MNRMPKTRKLLFFAIAATVTYAVCELIAYAGIVLLTQDFGACLAWQDERLASDTDSAAQEAYSRVQHKSTVIHPYLGFTLDADRHQEARPFGFVDMPEIPRKSEGQLIVAVMGGSVAHNFCSAGMPRLASAIAEHTDQRVVQVNLACPGYKQPQQLFTLAYLLALGAEFDMVVNIDGFNEVATHAAENGQKGVSPIYPRNWYFFSHLLGNKTALKMVGIGEVIRADIDRINRFHARMPLACSPIANALWRIRVTRKQHQLDQLITQMNRDEPYHPLPAYVEGPLLDRDAMHMLVETWRRCSLQIERLCQSNGIAYYHFLQPNQYVEGSKPLHPTELKIAYNEDHPYRDGIIEGYRVLRNESDRVKSEGVNFTDLTMIFSKTSQPLYYDDCCHFNVQGHQIMADAISKVILDDMSP